MSITASVGIFTGSALRRVRREDVAKPAVNKPDPYLQLMACWVDYMRVDDRDLGSRGMQLATDAEPDSDVHAAQRAADLKLGETVNAMVDSLAMLHRWAIYKSQGIATAWRFANADYAHTLVDAREDLEDKLKKNIATRLYFS